VKLIQAKSGQAGDEAIETDEILLCADNNPMLKL